CRCDHMTGKPVLSIRHERASTSALHWAIAVVLFSIAGQPAGYAQAPGTVLKGRAVEQGFLQPGRNAGGPTLTRSDIDRLGDPFGGGSPPDADLTQMIEPPPAAPPARGFARGAQIYGFGGQAPGCPASACQESRRGRHRRNKDRLGCLAQASGHHPLPALEFSI